MTVLAGIMGLGAAVLVLGMAPPEPLFIAAAALLTLGLMVPFCNGPIYAILQATIEPAFQGRVFALLGSLAAATAPLGLLLAAPIAASRESAPGSSPPARSRWRWESLASSRRRSSGSRRVRVTAPARAMSGIALE